jgi:molybdopterin converting factor subunit 1
MRVTLLYFGVLRDFFGVSDETLELMDGATVGGLLDLLRPRTPGDDRLWRSLAVAVNREYSSPGLVLRDGDEVALLPPVSGGCGARVYIRQRGGFALLANECRKTSYQSGLYVD